LYYLQQQLAEDEGVEYLKLALHADINPNTAELIKTPTDLFHAIAKGDEELALAKFHCALDSLGRQLRGHMCIRNADALYGLKLPPPLPRREQTTDFQFFLCLTKISKTLRNHRPNQCNGQKEVIRWFSSKRLLNTYHSNFHSLPELFVRAYRARIITPGDTHELHDCLSHHKLEKALKYLHEYYGAVFPPLPGVDNRNTNEDKEPTSQTSDSSLPDAAQRTRTAPYVIERNHGREGVTDEITSSSPSEGAGLTSSKDSDKVPALQRLHPGDIQPGSSTPQKRAHKRCLCCVLLLLMLSTVGLLVSVCIFTVFLWQPLHHIAASNPIRVLQQQGHTVVLGEVKQSLIRDVRIEEQALWPNIESSHEIDVFMVGSDCNSLANDVRYHNFSGGKEDFRNVSFYLMHQSVVEYSISATSNSSNPDPIYVYIIPGLKRDRDFKPDDDDNDDLKVEKVKVGTNGNRPLTPFTYQIEHSNYYTVKTIIPDEMLVDWAEYNLTIKERYINENRITDTIKNKTIESDQASAVFSISSGFGTWCIAAGIRNTTRHKNIHTDLFLNPDYDRVLGTTVSLTLVLALSVTVLTLVALCIKRNLLDRTTWSSILRCHFQTTSMAHAGRHYSPLSDSE
jgi:hypothetical protein